jgi:hypothetical protein
MHNCLLLALSLGFVALNATPTFGQSFRIRPQVTDLSAASSITLLPDSASPLMQGPNSGGRPHPAVARGARIGFTVGFVVGAVYFGTKKCDELGCLAKWAFGVPVMASLSGFLGALIGAEIGWLASGGANYAHARTKPVTQLRFGVTLRF